MFVPKDDKLRHSILKELLDKAESVNGAKVYADDTSITTIELAKKLNITVEKLHQVTSILLKDGVIEYNNFGNGECLFAWEHSGTAYYEKKYLRQGKKRVNDEISDVTKWVLPIVAIITSIITTFVNLSLSKDKLNMQQEITGLRIKVDSLSTLKDTVSPKQKNVISDSAK